MRSLHRSPDEFAVKVELKTPAPTLHKGLQVDDGTVAASVQGGKFNGFSSLVITPSTTFFRDSLALIKGKRRTPC